MPDTPQSDKHESLLKEIRDNFQYCVDAWRDIREQGKKDMACVAGDTWDPAERDRRQDPKQSRPCLCLDECGQYINQVINEVRQAKRSVMVIPRGSGANDKEAELRGNIIRDIEYDSNAQAAYITGFENALQRSYGWLRVSTAIAIPGKKEKKVVIKRIVNPDTVYPDPDFREADSSDKDYCFVVDYMSRKKYKREFPNASFQDFTQESEAVAPKWITPNKVQVAEYWKRDKAKDGTITVTQYLTNGLEILKETPWAGKYIPLVLFVGKEYWIDDDGGSKRVWESLVRKARDAQQLLNYYASTEAEVVKMVPKAPFMVPKGTVINKEEWQAVNDTPLAYLEYDPWAGNPAGQGSPIPPPARPAYDPPVQAMEIGKESARRSIQSAMGVNPLPTAAQRQNDKSGLAIRRIQDETQTGSFHFVDNYERGLMFCGRIINDLLAKVYDSEREVGSRGQDEEHKVITINGPSLNKDGTPEMDENNEPVTNMLTDGEYDVTISTGPSYESEREQADDFVQNLFEVIGSLPIDPAAKNQLVALAIKMKDLGPIGEEMIEVITPPDKQNIPPQIQAQIQQMQQELALSNATVNQLMQEKIAKHAELQNKIQIAQLEQDGKIALANIDREVKLEIAEITTKAQDSQQRNELYQDIWKELHGTAHESALSTQEHAQDLASSQQAAQQQQALAAQQSASESQAQQEPATVGA